MNLKRALRATAAVVCAMMAPAVGHAATAGQSATGQSTAAAPVAVEVHVDTSRPGPVIERDIYGQFAEHLGRGIYEGVWVGEKSRIPNTNGYRNDVVAALRRLKIPSIRWPGGCFSDEYDWRDGIGPRGKRPVRLNSHWGGVTEDNAFGTHEFMNFAEMIGTEAYVAGNMGSMPPRAMAQWMEYMTADKGSLAEERRANGRARPWKVKYFGIGNESWGCGGNMRAEYSADQHRKYSTFVKSYNGKTFNVATGSNGEDYNWTDVLMQRAGDKMDALSVHYYTLPGNWTVKGKATGFTEAEWAVTLKKARFMDELIGRHSSIMDKYDPQKRVGLFVDEWGTWYDQEAGSTPGFLYQQNSLRDAEVAALTLNIFHRHTDRVKLAAIAQMVNVLQAMILTDGPRMVLTPTYHVFEMYVPFQGATPYPATVSNVRYTLGNTELPMVDVSVARATDGKLWMALTNLDPNRAAQVATNLGGQASGRILTAAAMDAHNDFDRPDTVKPAMYQAAAAAGGKLTLDLPAKSVAVVQITE